MKLYVMRHGQAAASPQEPEQILTREGHSGVEKQANRLKRQGIQVSQVIHSTKTRARQTAEIMAQHIAAEITVRPHTNIKPNDDPRWLIKDINDWHEDTLVVSHLPFIPALLMELTGDQKAIAAINFQPGTIICLQHNGTTWEIDSATAP